jgi:hypothetical protein
MWRYTRTDRREDVEKGDRKGAGTYIHVEVHTHRQTGEKTVEKGGLAGVSRRFAAGAITSPY